MVRNSFFLILLLGCFLNKMAFAGLDTKMLDERIKPLAERTKGGKLGVGIKDLKSGQQWYLLPQQAFPMMSVYSLPIGIAVLRAVDAGRLRLDQEIVITRDELSPGWSPIARAFKDGSQSFTVMSLLEKAIGFSDNTAVDVLLKKVGGPRVVNTMLKQAGITGIRVDRYEKSLQASYFGIKDFSPDYVAWEKFQAAISAIPATERKDALDRFLADPRDTATPRGMIALLSKLESGKLLSAKSKNILLKVMQDSPTGRNRIEAGAAEGSFVANKTGSGDEVVGISGATNDVGIVTLPGGKKLAICVFLSGSAAPLVEREKVIAEVASVACQAVTHEKVESGKRN